jgi:para-aminobenzoate synthetase / 4-amino-4-deoxychorismate lyase
VTIRGSAPRRYARFDDLREGCSFELIGYAGELVARSTSEVVEVVEAAERAATEGHWVAGFIAYEAAPAFDPCLRTRDPDPDLPLAWFGIFDDRIPIGAPAAPTGESAARWALGSDERRHARAVARIKDHLADGDTYQVNLTMRATTDETDPEQLYASMCTSQGGSYNALLITGRHAVVCASPELLFERRGERLVTRPMKGTLRRGRWSAEDLERAAALAASAKDKAEHVMIVDLLRNDLGRTALPGTVRVESYAELERYPTVWQLTSTIAGGVDPDLSLASTFAALFPCGSVTGAPKPRTMEIIAAIEDSARGVYCGAVGFVAPGSDWSRFAVGIRTAVADSDSGRTVYGSGGGITWGSDAHEEWIEVQDKCSILRPVPVPEQLLETLRLDPDEGLVNLDAHLARLASSAEYFGIPFDLEAAEKELRGACDDAYDGVLARAIRRVRILLSTDGRLEVGLSAVPHADPGPVRLALAGEAVDSADVRLFHKVSDRRLYESLRSARRDADDVVMFNERGEVTEVTTANIAVMSKGTWTTPPLGCGLLPGVERARLLEAGVLREAVVSIDELYAADALAVLNSLRGWRRASLAV